MAELSFGTAILRVLWHPLLDIADNHLKFIVAFGGNRVRVLNLSLVTGVSSVSNPPYTPCNNEIIATAAYRKLCVDA